MHRLALGLALAASCRAATEHAPCGSVALRFETVARGELESATIDPSLRADVLAELPAMRDSLAGLCRDGAWPAAVRDCMARAQTRAAIETCESALGDAPRAALDRVMHRETGPR
ncbi:MAG TPA: hypothetical protein VLX92_34910 [Kofleriaceae bacterium]|nr:hypothetical protein [Kofleriaceae bacterium]